MDFGKESFAGSDAIKSGPPYSYSLARLSLWSLLLLLHLDLPSRGLLKHTSLTMRPQGHPFLDIDQLDSENSLATFEDMVF